MRRRIDTSAPPAELLTPPPEPYPIAPGVDPKTVLMAWRAAYDEWKDARDAWVAAGGCWPGGEDMREMQEGFATPDEPFTG